MVNVKHTFKYQPNPTSSFILWGWTVSLLCLAIIWLLETVAFTWMAVVLFGLSLVVIVLQIQMRRVTIDRNLIVFSSVTNHQWLVIPRDQLESISTTRHGLVVKIDGRQYHFLMLKKARQQVVDLLAK